jgi:hypothetical protein
VARGALSLQLGGTCLDVEPACPDAREVDPSSRLLARRLFWFAPYRRRLGSLRARGHMPVDEPLGAPAQRRVAILSPVEHTVGDFLGHIPGPPFDRVEGDDSERIPVLPRNHIADDRTEIGFSEVCL